MKPKLINCEVFLIKKGLNMHFDPYHKPWMRVYKGANRIC